jgi:hypothetical protein
LKSHNSFSDRSLKNFGLYFVTSLGACLEFTSPTSPSHRSIFPSERKIG